MIKIMSFAIVGVVCGGLAARADETPTPPQPPTSGETTTAAVSDDSNRCSNASLSGNYGSEIQGFRIRGRKLIPYASLRSVQFDGQGKLTSSGKASIGGKLVDSTSEGTYTIADNCAVTIEESQTFGQGGSAEKHTEFGVLVDGGDKILIMQTAGSRTVMGSFEKY